MSGEQPKSTTAPPAEQTTHPPALAQYPPQPFPGAPYPHPPGAYTWYYPPPADPNGDPNGPPPGPYVMFPPPGIMYGYPPPPSPAQGMPRLSPLTSPVCLFHRCLINMSRLWTFLGSHAYRDHTCEAQTSQDGGMYRLFFPSIFSVTLTGVPSARIARPPVSGATRHVRANDVKSMVSQTHVSTACERPERLGSSEVLTNVKANFRLQRRIHIQVSSHLPKKPIPTAHIFP